MVPSIHPLWMVPLIAAGLGLAVWLASFLYAEKESTSPERTGKGREVEGGAEPAV